MCLRCSSCYTKLSSMMCVCVYVCVCVCVCVLKVPFMTDNRNKATQHSTVNLLILY